MAGDASFKRHVGEHALVLLAAALMMTLNGAAAASSSRGGAAPLTRVHVIAHSHNDPGWLESESQYYQQRTRKILTNVVKSARMLLPGLDCPTRPALLPPPPPPTPPLTHDTLRAACSAAA